YYHKYISDTTKQVAREEWSTLKEVDEETFYCLYNRQYNPVVITISKNETNNENYNIMLSLFSIDDTAFKILLENKTLLEKEDIILEIIDYIDFNDIINYRSFLTYGIEVLKGIDVSY
ncbi:MAG: hypothetical protein RSF67_10435, partial [Clostridia bacterium]